MVRCRTQTWPSVKGSSSGNQKPLKQNGKWGENLLSDEQITTYDQFFCLCGPINKQVNHFHLLINLHSNLKKCHFCFRKHLYKINIVTYLYTCELKELFIFIPPSLLIVHICVSLHQCHQENMLRSSCPSNPHLCHHVIQKVKDVCFHFIAKNSLFIIILFSVIWLLCFVCVWLFIYMCGVLAWWFHSLCGGQPHILGVMNEHWDISCVSISVCVGMSVSLVISAVFVH